MEENKNIEQTGRRKSLPVRKLTEKFIEKAFVTTQAKTIEEEAYYNTISIKSSIGGDEVSYTPMIDWGNFDVLAIAKKLVLVSEVLTGIKLYPYQVEVQERIFESMLKNDGEEISILFARQSGKSEVVTCTIITIMIMFPVLAEAFSQQLGMYAKGVSIGLFAPTTEQAFTIHSRMDNRISSESATEFMNDSAIDSSKKYANGILSINGPVVRKIGDKEVYKYVSICRLQSAAKQSKIESKTYHLIVVDEAQDVDIDKLQRGIRPMVASTNGTIVELGTPIPQISDFYNVILRNKRTQTYKKIQNHFEYDYRHVQKYNPKYKAFIKKEIERLGEDSDAFRMAYKLEWLLEKGMALTPQQFEEYMKEPSGRFEYQSDGESDYVAGLDLAKISDSSVITIAKLLPEVIPGAERGKKIVNWVEMSGDNWEMQFLTICEIVKTYNIKILTVDSTGGRDIIIERLQIALENEDCLVYPMIFSQKSKHEMATLFYDEMRKQNIRIPAHQSVKKTRRFKNFMEQFFSAEKNYKGQYMQIEHPKIKGAKDDYIDSLLLLLIGCKHNSVAVTCTQNNPFFTKTYAQKSRFKKAIHLSSVKNKARWGRTVRF